MAKTRERKSEEVTTQSEYKSFEVLKELRKHCGTKSVVAQPESNLLPSGL